MSEEEDFTRIPLEVRWRHTKWKARQSAYDTVATGLNTGKSTYQPSPDDLKLCVSDSNVIALEAGIKAVAAVLKSLPGESLDYVSIRQAVTRPIAEKGLVAAKPAVKQSSVETLLTLVEVADPDGIVEDILSMMATVKSPKAIAAAVQALDKIFSEFGSPVADPRPVLKILPGLFGNTDRSVRQAASVLACSLCRWVGEPTLLQVLNTIKPVQQNELKANLNKMDFSAPPPRLTRRQQQLDAQHDGGDEMNAEIQVDTSDGQNGGANKVVEIDPWDLAEPVDVISKIPSDFWTLLSSVKWKERHEALTSLLKILEDAEKMDPQGSYSQLINELIRIVQKDMNQMCATQSMQGLCFLALGLRNQYSQYVQTTLEAVVDRFKEKKQSVVDVVTRLIDSIYFHVIKSQFSPLIDTVVEVGMKHKTPQVRIESAKYLAHILCETSIVPKFSEVEQVGIVAVRLLGDTNEPMRAAAAAVLAALVKLAGMQKLAKLMDGLDEHKKKRVNDALAKTVVKASPSQQPAQPAMHNLAQSKQPLRAHQIPQQTTASKPSVTFKDSSKAPAPRHGSLRPNQGQPIHHQQPHTPASSSMAYTNQYPPASPPSRRTLPQDSSMGLTSPPQLMQPGQRPSRPSLSSTPKIVKRTSTNADFTPARGVDTFRRRIYSPAKPQVGSPTGGPSEPPMMRADVGEIARITAEFEVEKNMRLECEKKLARVQVDKDREISRLQEEVEMLKLQLRNQKAELELWLRNKERWSQSTLNSDDMGNRLSVLSLDADNNTSGRPASRPPSRRPPSRVLPISSQTELPGHSAETVAVRTGTDDWERAVSMTHSLRKRVELLQQQKQRNMAP